MKKDTLIAVYNDHKDAADAVEALTKAGLGKEHISVLGKGEMLEEDSFEYQKENEDILYWGKTGAFWGGLWGFLMGALFFWVPGFGPLVATGPIIASLAGLVGGAAVVGSLSALAAWLVDLGMTEAEALRYEDFLKEGKFLVLVQGSDEELQKAQSALEALGKGEIKLHQK